MPRSSNLDPRASRVASASSSPGHSRGSDDHPTRTRAPTLVIVAGAALVSAVACGGVSENESGPGAGGSGGTTTGAAGAGNDAGPSKPLYAVMYQIYDDAGSTSYLNVLDSLDIDEVE